MQLKLNMTQVRAIWQYNRRQLSELLDKRTKALDNSIESKEAKAYVSYKAPTAMKFQFMRVSPSRYYLIVRLAIPIYQVQDPCGLCRIEPCPWRPNVIAINFTSENELDYIMCLVKQAYDFNLIPPNIDMSNSNTPHDRRAPMSKKDYKYCNVRIRADYAFKVKQLSQIRMTKQTRICEALYMLPTEQMLLERMNIGKSIMMKDLRLGKSVEPLGYRAIALTETTYQRVKTIAKRARISIAQFITVILAVSLDDLEYYIDSNSDDNQFR